MDLTAFKELPMLDFCVGRLGARFHNLRLAKAKSFCFPMSPGQ